MSMFISVLILAGVIVAVVRLVMAEEHQPATGSDGSDPDGAAAPVDPAPADAARPRRRAAHAARSRRSSWVSTGAPGTAVPAAVRPLTPPGPGERITPLRWWQRLRTGVMLLILLTVLGLTTAAIVGLAAVAIVQTLRGAVG